MYICLQVHANHGAKRQKTYEIISKALQLIYKSKSDKSDKRKHLNQRFWNLPKRPENCRQEDTAVNNQGMMVRPYCDFHALDKEKKIFRITEIKSKHNKN